MVNGSDLIVTQLKSQGVPWISTLCGNGLNPLFDSCRRAGVGVVDTHNEQAAAYLADAYARLTGNLGVCAASSGIAHINALTGLSNAYFDGAPVLLITGASTGYGTGRGVFQEFDQVGLAAPICKFSELVADIDDLSFLLREAISKATSGRPGPVHLTIPEDVLKSEAEDLPAIARVEKPLPPLPADSALSRACARIQKSERPVLVAGTRVSCPGITGEVQRGTRSPLCGSHLGQGVR
jgi:acetolactate synthase-1/2/3 large subunit